MARDIDAIKIAGHETRGRRSKAEKARGLTETLKGFEATAKGLTRSLDFALPLGLFAFTSWSSRMRITATSGTVTFILLSADRLTSAAVYPTYQGRRVSRLDFGYPELHAAEGMGMLTILLSMPGSDVIGLVENGLALAIYHAYLNSASILLPGGAKLTGTSLDAFLGLWAWVFAPQTSTGATLGLPGLFRSAFWTLTQFQANLQAEVDRGRITIPTGDNEDVPLDPLVRRVQLDSLIKALAHGAFLTLLLKRGGGIVPTE